MTDRGGPTAFIKDKTIQISQYVGQKDIDLFQLWYKPNRTVRQETERRKSVGRIRKYPKKLF